MSNLDITISNNDNVSSNTVSSSTIPSSTITSSTVSSSTITSEFNEIITGAGESNPTSTRDVLFGTNSVDTDSGSANSSLNPLFFIIPVTMGK